jgi:hypothetical protein
MAGRAGPPFFPDAMIGRDLPSEDPGHRPLLLQQHFTRSPFARHAFRAYG